MTSRTRRKVLRLAAVGALAAIVSSCASSGPRASTTTTERAPSTTATTGPPTTSVGTSAVRIYLMRTDMLSVVGRSVPATPAVASAALRALLAGPSPAEAADGLGSAIPSGTSLRSVSIRNGTADVDLSGAFGSGGGSLSMTARLAQVTYTLTQFPSVTGVTFRLDGVPVTTFGGEGIILDQPATRASFESLTPAILVESPTPGATVAAPLRVWGTANVFEAQFRLEVLDSTGRVIVSEPVHATAGTGTRGTFDVSIPTLPASGTITLRLFDLSAKDGSPQDVVTIPVQLGPSG